MKQIQKGFTLIELLIVVTIIGVLAAIAIPFYQDYRIRARASELILAASSLRETISERAQSRGDISNVALGLGLTIGSSQWVDYGYVGSNGTIVVVAKPAIGTAAMTATLRPVWDGVQNAIVAWSCGLTPAKYAPGGCSQI